MYSRVRVVLCLLLLLPVLSANAIKVCVETKSAKVFALGFTVNKKSHGGMGSSYTKKDMPADANYGFGLRAGGIFGDDVTCYTPKGKKQTVKLSKDSVVKLNYDGRNCSFLVSTLKSK